jgi:hypothetical protein
MLVFDIRSELVVAMAPFAAILQGAFVSAAEQELDAHDKRSGRDRPHEGG